jgi:hypothetical protein
MSAVIFVSLALAVGQSPATADEASKTAVKKLAQEMSDATVRGDFGAVFDHTYAPLVKKLGGRAKAIESVETTLKQMKGKGFDFKKVEVGDPQEFLTEGDSIFIIVPTTVEMTCPAGTIRAKSYLLGISTDGKKSWAFVDGAGMRDKEVRKQVLPKMPDKLKLPELQAPEVIKEK